jgi:hypothetical protein
MAHDYNSQYRSIVLMFFELNVIFHIQNRTFLTYLFLVHIIFVLVGSSGKRTGQGLEEYRWKPTL